MEIVRKQSSLALLTKVSVSYYYIITSLLICIFK